MRRQIPGRGKTLMIQGTSSSVGKSLIVAGLCRAFARRGVSVAPFKAQNMSNNAAVCADGAEIGRAQALQARAARIEPTADMNPVLLKPEGDSRSQVIVLGRPWQTLGAVKLHQSKRDLWPIATAALDRLRASFELVIIEGAGSPVELNLAAGDIVNMALARHAQAPVLLVGDIDRGGIFAQLLGTLWLFTPEEKKLVRGLIINKFRGDRALFADGVHILEERGGVPVMGVLPWIHSLELPEEDAVALDVSPRNSSVPSGNIPEITVIQLPHIANFDDFDPLRRAPEVRVRFVTEIDHLGRPDVIILPGTKTTIADLEWMRSQGLDRAIAALANDGVEIVGVCGGYQMLGQAIRDPYQVESSQEATEGLGLLPVETVFAADKATFQVRGTIFGGPGWLATLAGTVIEGYEIHMGTTESSSPWLELERRGSTAAPLRDGAVNASGRVWGCYVHGLFANEVFVRAWLGDVVRRRGSVVPRREPSTISRDVLDAGLDRLADALEQALDMNRIMHDCDL
jgi:adenosylcobyric acid synthase